MELAMPVSDKDFFDAKFTDIMNVIKGVQSDVQDVKSDVKDLKTSTQKQAINLAKNTELTKSAEANIKKTNGRVAKHDDQILNLIEAQHYEHGTDYKQLSVVIGTALGIIAAAIYTFFEVFHK